MGMLSEDRKSEGLALGLSIADNLTMTRLEPFGPQALVVPARQKQAASDWIARLAIKCAGPSQPAGELSGGNQQKVAIARLLHHDVDVLLLDEPTRGIDVGSKAQIYKLIDELVALRPGSGPADRPPPATSALPAPAWPTAEGGADGQQLPPRAARRVRSHRRHVPRPARRAARPVAGLTEHDLMVQADDDRQRAAVRA